MSEMRVYGADELGADGYPRAWDETIKHRIREEGGHRCALCQHPYVVGESAIWEQDDLHPRRTRRETGFSQATWDAAFEELAETLPEPGGGRRTNWSVCGAQCAHAGPLRVWTTEGWTPFDPTPEAGPAAIGALLSTFGNAQVQAAWRILTVHHLTGEKADCRWWNLVALCQRDHLLLQRRGVMDRPWPWAHAEWFKTHAAGWYAHHHLGLDLTREETVARLDELLDLGAREAAFERMAL